jgi:L-fuconolactonase
MKIDTHQHFWKYNEQEYGWMGPGMEILKSDHLPEKLAPLLKKAGIDGTIAVQARQTPQETDFLLKFADNYRFICGVVGWVDLRCPQLEVLLESICFHPRLCGLRHVLHDEPDDQFMLRQDFVYGISKLRKYNLAYDLLLFAKHLPVACELVAKFPEQTFVLDHISKPLIKDAILEPWAADIRKLASFKNVSCKISGMVTEANWQNWQPADFKPYIETVTEAFGTDRIMIGSDWPVCTVAGRYEDVIGIAADFVAQLSPEEQKNIWSANAIRIYDLNIYTDLN